MRKEYTDLNKQQRKLVANYATLETAKEQHKVLADEAAESDGKPITVDGRIAGEEKHIVVRE